MEGRHRVACFLGWFRGQSAVQRGPIKEEQVGQSQRPEPAVGLGEEGPEAALPGWAGGRGLPPSVVVGQPLCL